MAPIPPDKPAASLLPRAAALAALAAGITVNYGLARVLAERALRRTVVADWVHDVPKLELASALTGGLTILTAVLLWNTPVIPLRRAARFTCWSMVVTLILWMAPVPFSPQRHLCVIAILIGAVLYGLACLRIVFGRAEVRPGKWTGCTAALGMMLTAAAAMFLEKLHVEGYNQAID